MTTINTQISSLSGYDATQYAALTAEAEALGVSTATVDSELLAAIAAGKSFSEAVSSVTSDLPDLAEPTVNPTTNSYYICSGLPSPGAAMLATMIEGTAEERRDNTELRVAQTKVIVQNLENQADEMRSKASAQLAMGIASGAISIGMGALTMGLSVKSTQASLKEYDTFTEGLADGATEAQKQAGTVAKGAYDAINSKQQSISTMLNQVGSGASTTLNSVNEYVGAIYDTKIKELEADREQEEAFRDILESLDEALSQQISKAISTMEAIQSDMNQTRTRIMG